MQFMIAKDADHHLECFVRAFVQKSRQDRWNHLLRKRDTKTYNSSHKLYDVLDRAYAKSSDLESIDETKAGCFYDFSDIPESLTFAQALKRGLNRDAIFSIDPGKFAIFFFHEGDILICRRT